MDIIVFNGIDYPKYQTQGFAAKFIFPFAKEVCFGKGYDIGCNREEWKLPNAIGIDPLISGNLNATNLPTGEVDYIFSSHCLEHLDRWVDVLDYWYLHLKTGGTLFLYLPDKSQEYWLPWNNRKHVQFFTPDIIRKYLTDKGYKNVFVSGVDLNNSFAAMAEK
jgi:SAM-dependent methyltransferase